MTRAPALPATDRLLTMREAGERLHLTKSRLKSVVDSSPALRAGRRYRGTRPYIVESALVRHIHVEMGSEPVATTAAPS